MAIGILSIITWGQIAGTKLALRIEPIKHAITWDSTISYRWLHGIPLHRHTTGIITQILASTPHTYMRATDTLWWCCIDSLHAYIWGSCPTPIMELYSRRGWLSPQWLHTCLKRQYCLHLTIPLYLQHTFWDFCHFFALDCDPPRVLTTLNEPIPRYLFIPSKSPYVMTEGP